MTRAHKQFVCPRAHRGHTKAHKSITPIHEMTYDGKNKRAGEGKGLCAPLPLSFRGGARAQGHKRMEIFDVKGDPKPWSLSRGKAGNVYVPSVVQHWKHDVRAAAVDALGDWKLIPPGVAVEVHFAFRLARPKSHMGTGRNAGKLKPSAPRDHTQKPDKGNLEKAAQDALGQFEGMPPLVWCDDCQVTDGRTTKRWAAPGEEPGVAIAIMELN